MRTIPATLSVSEAVGFEPGEVVGLDKPPGFSFMMLCELNAWRKEIDRAPVYVVR